MTSTSILVHHQSGSKANRIERFPLDSTAELSIGRDPSCGVAYDPQRDDAVSRRHAVIKVVAREPPTFTITDLGSSNGTSVNGARVSGEAELLPTDTVQLGAGGPSFVFDLDPRPLVARTRVIDVVASPATRIGPAPQVKPIPETTAIPTGAGKVGVGRETVARMLSDERRTTSRVWMYTLAGVLAVVGVAGGSFYWWTQHQREQTLANVEEEGRRTRAALELQKLSMDQQAAQQQKDLKTQMGVSPAQIIENYGNATVFVTFQWRVFDRETGKSLFHKMLPYEGGAIPAYVALADGRVVRWLTTEDENHNNREVGTSGEATGFVISDQGFILTNKHVAAAWMINYNQFTPYETAGRGLLCKVAADSNSKRELKPDCSFFNSPKQLRDAVNWIPESGGTLFDARVPRVIGGQKRSFDARNELLEVRFPGSRLGVQARLVRASTDADAALIKIDAMQALTSVEMAPTDEVTVGGNITVLGYPGSSEIGRAHV